MANFAAKLNQDGESYDRMFESFKPIGLFAYIGILTPENIFITKDGKYDLNGKISFAEESKRGEYISGIVQRLSGESENVIRSAVPIKVNNKVVGVIYGIIRLETINNRYNAMAKELDAQLFVYDKADGNYIIHTIADGNNNISSLSNREYNDEHTYEELITKPSGFSSFKSLRTGEDLYIHFSTIEDFNWGIILARYESQVFAKTNAMMGAVGNTFIAMMLIIFLYVLYRLRGERRNASALSHASDIRKLLLDVNQYGGNFAESLKHIVDFSNARSSFYIDADGDNYKYYNPIYNNQLLEQDERQHLIKELFRYVGEYHNINKNVVTIMSIVPNFHLYRTNRELHTLFKKRKIKEVTFAAVTDKNNYINILGAINPKKRNLARIILDDVAVCFSIALYNKKHLNRTEVAATTDALTGVLNRVSYKKDILEFDRTKPYDFACVYIDVNELHLRNNKYGHAAGDEMLIFIANTLKEVFYGHHIYRMGGDEFMVFTQDISQEQVKDNIDALISQLAVKEYNVAIGMSYRTQNVNCEEMVREAEIRMYEAKAQYYQNKENTSISKNDDQSYTQTKTGISEIDTMLSVLHDHYNGIYRVSLDTDKARRILMPSYLGYKENEEHFSELFANYVNEFVHPDFNRSVMSFLNYDAIRRQLSEGYTPRITYKKQNGEPVILSVYKLGSDDVVRDTLWVFAKD